MSNQDLLSRDKLKNYLTSFYKTKELLNNILEKEGIKVELDQDNYCNIERIYKTLEVLENINEFYWR